MNFRDMVRALRAAWWMPALGVVLGGLAAVGVTVASTPVYTSGTQLFISTTDSSSTSEVYQGNQFAEKRIASYAELLTSPELAARVADRLGLDLAPDELASNISATPVSGTVVLDVSVTDASAEQAQDIAQAVGSEFISVVNELETPAGADVSPVKVTVFGAAELPLEPSSPNPALNLAAGLFLGLLLGTATAIARDRLDRSVKDADQAAEVAGAPAIAVILRDDELRTRHRFEPGSYSRGAEAYRQLQTNLQFLDVDHPPRVLMISSALPAEGKTTVAVNLALALAEAGQRVVIVEADLRRPRVTSYLGMVGDVGLTNILAGQATVADVAQPHGDGSLVVIASGPKVPNPAQLLASGNMSTLLDELRAAYDYVILDAPPVLPVADSTGLAVLADGVLLSIRHGSTTREQLQRTRDTLDRVGATTFGVVLNMVPVRDEAGLTYGYGYDYDDGGRPAPAVPVG
jgi:capsular exopolysaccharide synthesis family protein